MIRATYGKRDLQHSNNWEEIDINKFRVEKPTIFCFGGNMTTTEKSANGICKLVESLIGTKEDEGSTISMSNKIDIVSVAYKNLYSATGEMNEDDIEDFVNNIFNDLIKPNDKLLKPEQLYKNMGKVCFFSHCYGDWIAREITDMVYIRTLMSGYNKDVAKKAIEQIYSVSYSPIREEYGYHVHNNNTSFCVKPFSDKLYGKYYQDEYNSDTGKNLTIETFDFANQNYRGEILDNCMSLYSFKLLNSTMDHHTVSMLIRDNNWQLKNDIVEDGMNDIKYNTKADIASMCMGYVLASSMANALQNENTDDFKPNPTGKELLNELKDISKFATKNIYGLKENDFDKVS